MVMDATVAVNPTVVAPAVAVTLAGTVALALLLDNATARPPLGAAPLSVTVAPLPAVTGLTVPEMVQRGATRPNENVCEVLLAVAVRVAV